MQQQVEAALARIEARNGGAVSDLRQIPMDIVTQVVLSDLRLFPWFQTLAGSKVLWQVMTWCADRLGVKGPPSVPDGMVEQTLIALMIRNRFVTQVNLR